MKSIDQMKVKGPEKLLAEKHESYLKNYGKDEQFMDDYIKMSGVYWVINALYIMDSAFDQNDMLRFIKTCQNDDGGFASAPGHDSHILHTLSAVQVLMIFEKLSPEHIDIEKCAKYVVSLQQLDGSFFGDKWGEVDTRFSFCALATLKLLDRLYSIDINEAVKFIMSCNNQIDGGFGGKPGSESHSAYVYCCVGSLAIAERLDLIDTDQLGCWLAQRQVPSGGLNGRPEKLPDLCYSWWCLASMTMIGKLDAIDEKKLIKFILACQDQEEGGFSDRPGNWCDPYHTMFGIASLSLLAHNNLNGDLKVSLKPVSPIFCMAEDRLNTIGKLNMAKSL